jgi:hypothetical protein
VSPSASQKYPTGQSVQVVAYSALYFPSLQATDALVWLGHSLSASHFVQDVSPSSLQNPVGQLIGEVYTFGQYFPAGHKVQSDDPNSEYSPDAHATGVSDFSAQ